MTEKVTDEMLMAFVDGETDRATAAMIERALAADAALGARAEMFRAHRTLLQDAFGQARHEPVPEALIAAALRGEQNAKVIPFRRRQSFRFMLPLAASLMLAFGAAGYVLGQFGVAEGDPLAHAAMAEALGQTGSGETRAIALAGGNAELETLATYRIEGGHCRSFSLSGPYLGLSGIGCDRGQGWAVDLTVAASGGDGVYAPASGAALQSIDAFLDALEASAPLSAEEEAELLGN